MLEAENHHRVVSPSEHLIHLQHQRRIRQHTAAYVSIRRARRAPHPPAASAPHTSAYVSIRRARRAPHPPAPSAPRWQRWQHTSAYVSIRHTSAYVSIRHTSAYVSIRRVGSVASSVSA
jgi:hypothetical protein